MFGFRTHCQSIDNEIKDYNLQADFCTQNKNRTHFQARKCFQAQFISQAQFQKIAESVPNGNSFSLSDWKPFCKLPTLAFHRKTPCFVPRKQ